MKIYSKRHQKNYSVGYTGTVTPVRGFITCPYIPQFAVVDEVPFYAAHDEPYTHVTLQKKPGAKASDVLEALGYICSSSLRVDETKVTDFGDGDFTLEMWVHPAPTIDVIEKAKVHSWTYLDGVKT